MFRKCWAAGSWWFTPVILVLKRLGLRGSWIQSGLGKKFKRPYLN
jgi:hypothetical protein